MLNVGERLTLECVESGGCGDCTFNGDSELGSLVCKETLCLSRNRSDGKSVIFQTIRIDEPEQPKAMSTAERTSLRDFFAGQAMQAMLSNPEIERLPESHAPGIAKFAYTQAAAMLAEREKHL
jgi:hypothetical protein